MRGNGNWGYLPNYSHQNYTMRFNRQSRITGEWSHNVKDLKRIPKLAYLGGILFVMVFWLANFL